MIVADGVTYWVMSEVEMAYARCLGSVQVRMYETDWSNDGLQD